LRKAQTIIALVIYNRNVADAKLEPRQAGGGKVQEIRPGAWKLSLPDGPAGVYRWAQLDDYLPLPSSRFLWRPPFSLKLRARVSGPDLPGTWGFGLWNDPFSMSFGLGGAARRIPALPNCAWFFHGSPPNFLSLRDDLPAQGFFAGTFQAPRLPAPLLALGSPAAALLLMPITARLLRRIARIAIRQDGARVDADPVEWHEYRLDWLKKRARFHIDGREFLDTGISPSGPLGLVLWIDNQYAAFPPNGRVRFGTVSNPEAAWLEVELI
jgi:hypothetical protein